MMNNIENKKKGFWEKLTGSVRVDEDYVEPRKIPVREEKKPGGWIEEESSEAELAVDVYQTPTEIIIQTMVAGVRPEDIELSIARDLVTIKGKREEARTVNDESYFSKELYWGKFSRSILLPQEVEPEEAEALEKHGLLTIRLQKIDREKKNTIRVKSL